MCGVAGWLGPTRTVPAADERFRPVLAHRGPDGFGVWQDREAGVALLHWRLAVIELGPAGHQPMISRDGRFVLSYNGEVYDFDALRAEVDRHRGASSWRGRSDTEVIVEGVALWGPELLSRLNGIFALALYDVRAGTLTLARDRAGVKPLYVHEADGVVAFASEAKFLFAMPTFTPRVDPRGLCGFVKYAHCYAGHHVLAGVRQLAPGEVVTYARAADGGARVTSTTRLAPPPRWTPRPRADRDAAAALRDLLARVVARQLVADVPVGVLLSGGVDSSILTALAARHLGPSSTHAFTLGYRGLGPDYDEIEHARRVARHLGVQHHVYEATEDDLVQNLEQLVWHYDEPFADAAALNVFVLSRLIRSRVTVALAGEGSDELFGGYRRYQLEQAIRSLGRLGSVASAVVGRAGLDRATRVPRRVQVLLRALARPTASARYSSYLESEIPVERLVRPEWRVDVGTEASIAEGYPDRLEGGAVGHLCVVDQRFWLPSTYLEKSDKGAMAHALEIRVPFLDNEVVEFANTLPDAQRIRGRTRKWLLREAFGSALPPEVFGRFKRGFGVPVGRWLRHELRSYYLDTVLSPQARVRAYLDHAVLEAAFRAHERGARDHSNVLWQCLVLEIWLRRVERGFARRDDALTTGRTTFAA